MKSLAITDNFTEADVDALAVTVFKDEKANSGTLKDLDKLTGGLLASIFKTEEFKGETGETAFLRFTAKGKTRAERLLLVGAGEKEEFKTADVAIVSGTATRFLRKRNIKNFALLPRSEGNAAEVAGCAAQGVITSQFELDKYKSQDKNGKSIDTFVLCIEGAKESDVKDGLKRGEIVGESMNFTRDLANEPPNILHPTEMAKRAEKMAKEVGLKCEILDEKQMEKLGMGSLMSVSLGS
ncbi:MAG: hypothetical protein H0U50_10580, partial [Pyrinomonadaceae bacterium]|nr:hypothetical protein [Pyrinomonadaceae bacterium]